VNKLPVYKTEGIILKIADLGELDRLLTIYSQGYGKIQARAISVRKPEAKLKGYLQYFVRGRFLLAKSKTIDIVTDLEVKDSYRFLRVNLKSLAYAFYFSELIDKLVVAPEADQNIWRLVCWAFEVLNQPRKDFSNIRLVFEDKLVEFLGYSSFSRFGKNQSAQRLAYLQTLAGKKLDSFKFLSQLN